MSRKNKSIDKGEAISMEDALSMLVVIFVLFVVFLVPLVSMEKPPQIKKVPLDPFWATVSRSFSDKDTKALRYTQNFGIHFVEGSRIHYQDGESTIEILTQDSSVMVINHDLQSDRFVSLFIPSGGKSIIYNLGHLKWDGYESEWQVVDKVIEYYPGEITEKTEFEYKQWFRNILPLL